MEIYFWKQDLYELNMHGGVGREKHADLHILEADRSYYWILHQPG